MNILFIGLGVMGYPMAGHLSSQSKQTFKISVYNRTPAKTTAWIKEYSGTAVNDQNLLQVVTRSDVICTCLGGDPDVEEMLISKKVISQLSPNSTLIDHTTTSPTMARRLAKACEIKNVTFFDAPISGGQAGAEQGKLSIMVGGNSNDFDRIQPILKTYGKNIVLVGGHGAGQGAKMINQVCIAGLLQGLAEAIYLGKKTGIDMEKVLSVISKGAAQSWQMDNRSDTMLKNEYDFGFAVKWMIKDLKFALDEAQKNNLELPITQDVLSRYQTLLKNDLGHLDTSSLLTLLDKNNK